jgi:chemotaxis protein MotB
MVSSARRPSYLRHDLSKQDRWLASYADVVTVLLVLFVAAAAQGLARKREPVLQPAAIASIVSAPQPAPEIVAPAPKPAETLSPELLALRTKLREHNADLEIEPRGVVISLPQAVLFPPGQAMITKSAQPLIEEIADAIRDIPNRISLIGHSDGTPISNKRFNSNWELSTARSVKLLETLATEFKIPEARLSVASFGPYQPKTTNETPEGRAENRRVEIVILPE